MIAIGDKGTNRWHLQLADCWVIQYNVYVNDREWGRMFVRMCPYLPFSARVCLNQHHWLATQMRAEALGYLDVQQDILETFVDRGQLRRLAEPTITP
jgi:hypothetical protein